MSQHHDPVHPDGGHLTAEVLADFDLGLLDADSAAHAEHHLEHCDPCRRLHADLATLTETLGELDDAAPEPMPADVWDQLSAALAAEPVTTPQGSATVLPLSTSKPRRRRPGIGLVAGAAGVALVGAIGVSLISNHNDGASTVAGSDSNTDAGEAAPQAPTEAFAATRSGTQYKEDELSDQVTELVAARETSFVADSDTAGGSPSTSPSTDPSQDGDPGGDPSEISKQLRKALASAGPMVTDPAAAQECLESYLDVQGTAPLAVDIGIWQGKPAAVIVLPVDDPDLVQVWIINPACDPAGQDPLYYYATVAAG